MIRNNNRNSRDDKSTPGNRDTSNRRPSGTESSYKGKSSFGDKEGKEGGYKGRKPFGDKEGGAGSFGGAGRSSTGRTENTGNYKGGSRPEGGSSYKGAGRSEGSSTYKGAGRTEGGSSYKGGSRTESSSTYKGAGRTEGGSSYKGGSRTEGGSTYKGKRTFGENESRAAIKEKDLSKTKKVRTLVRKHAVTLKKINLLLKAISRQKGLKTEKAVPQEVQTADHSENVMQKAVNTDQVFLLSVRLCALGKTNLKKQMTD
jgi:hypothetical protein